MKKVVSSERPIFLRLVIAALGISVTSIDCVSVTGAGGFPSQFCGTSASAPHVAGVVALLLQTRPALTTAQVLFALQSTAADRGSGGFDNTYGSGLIDALGAVAE